jgi:hypothetical protein
MQLFSRISAVLLLAIFLSAMLVEGLHQHQDQLGNCKSKIEQAEHMEPQIHVAKLKCKLCEVWKSQSHYFDVPSATNFILFAAVLQENIPVYAEKHPDRYILAATNKGPPSLMA